MLRISAVLFPHQHPVGVDQKVGLVQLDHSLIGRLNLKVAVVGSGFLIHGEHTD
jgi:hypothetical protein